MVEWLVVVHSDAPLASLVMFVDVDLGEERLVEQPPGVVAGFQVGGVAVPGQIQRVRQHRAGLFKVGIDHCELLLDPMELGGDPLLLAFQ